MADILNKILATEAEEVAAQKAVVSTEEIRRQAQAATPMRDFVDTIRTKYARGLPTVIAEIKKTSPSKGLIRASFRPTAITTAYENTGAACLSVLTDEPYFQDPSEYLKQVKAAVGLSVLRKDFIISEYRVYQTRAWGADAILFITTALDTERLERLKQATHSLNMTALLELHKRDELEKYRSLTTPLWGVNSRNLRTFEASLQQTLDLLSDLAGKTVVTESGVRNKDDVGYMRAHGVHTFFIGETFMRADDIGTKIRKLFWWFEDKERPSENGFSDDLFPSPTDIEPVLRSGGGKG